MSLLIKNVLLKERKTDIYVNKGKIEKISPRINKKAKQSFKYKNWSN